MILEFCINDDKNGEFESPARRAYEQLMRKSLRLASHAAVVQLNVYGWWNAHADGVSEGVFYARIESQLATLARYYDCPALSLRAAAWRLMHAGVDGFKV